MMNRQKTPQWRARVLTLIASCVMIVIFSAQTWFIVTHRADAALVYGVEGVLGMMFGALIILLAVVRARRWPLPPGLRGPEVAVRYSRRLAYTGVFLLLVSAYMARSIIHF